MYREEPLLPDNKIKTGAGQSFTQPISQTYFRGCWKN